MRAGAEPIQRRRLHEIVVERLLAGIQAGEPPPGGALPSEGDLMARFGVGRPTVREALLRLENMGVIAIAHGERARVLEPSAGRILGQLDQSMVHFLGTDPASLRHLQEARLLVEEAMVRRATERLDDTGRARLSRILDRQERAVAEGEGFFAADMDFHVAIAECAGNPLFPIFLRAVLDWLGAFHASTVRLSGFERLALDEHRAIFAPMAAGDAEGAAAAMRAHLERSSALYGVHRRRAER